MQGDFWSYFLGSEVHLYEQKYSIQTSLFYLHIVSITILTVLKRCAKDILCYITVKYSKSRCLIIAPSHFILHSLQSLHKWMIIKGWFCIYIWMLTKHYCRGPFCKDFTLYQFKMQCHFFPFCLKVIASFIPIMLDWALL